jgi:hypothetical protein
MLWSVSSEVTSLSSCQREPNQRLGQSYDESMEVFPRLHMRQAEMLRGGLPVPSQPQSQKLSQG